MDQPHSASPPASRPLPHLDVEGAVLDRYRHGAVATEVSLCSPVSYDSRYLDALPQEILERDYGCGDPSRFVRPGETVLDLGSGGGKICYIISQIVGPSGRVIGVDFNDAMLSLSRKYLDEMGRRLGFFNVEFRKGKIQDLALDCEQLDRHLTEHPVSNSGDLLRVRQFEEELRHNSPLVSDQSVDLLVSNCVLNLVRPEDRSLLFREMNRVLKPGGRVAISDIVSDEAVPAHLRQDPELWSGCVSGAFQEEEFLRAFEDAGFHGMAVESWSAAPYRTVEGIEFRSITMTAHKGIEGPCIERNQAVIYRGPYRSVTDDDHHTYPRGVRVAVCEKTFRLLREGPYRDDLIFIEPLSGDSGDQTRPFDCNRTAPRHPSETKGVDYRITTQSAGNCCEPGRC
jgi:arsenite methyltransferase